MDEEESISMVCQVCGSQHVMDESGEFVPTGKTKSKDAMNGTMIRSEHSDGRENWRNDDYINFTPKSYRPPAVMMSITDTVAAPNNADPALTKANEVDLQKRNIKPENNND